MLIDIHTPDESGDFITLMKSEREIFNGKVLTVPAGFSYDGASVPRFFWRIVFPPVHPKSRRAALFHDFIYRTHPEGWTKADADCLFYNLLLEDGVPKWRAWLAYQGVNLFGRIAWETRGEC